MNLVGSPQNPNISMQIPHADLHTFPKMLVRRICLTITIVSFVGDHFPHSRDLSM